MFNMFEIPAIKHVFEFILSNLTSLWKDDLVAQLAKALYQLSVDREFKPCKELSLFSSFSNKMAGISNMFNIMKRQVYKKTSKVKLVLDACVHGFSKSRFVRRISSLHTGLVILFFEAKLNKNWPISAIIYAMADS